MTPKVNFKGDDKIKPIAQAEQKQKKDETVKKAKSEIKPKAQKDTKIKKPISKCPIQKNANNSVPKKPTKNKNIIEKCNVSALQVQKDGGTYVLNVKSTPFTSTAGVLSIVAGYNKRIGKIKCSLSGLAGPCQTTHKNKVFDFTDPNTVKTDAKLEFDAASVYEFSFFPSHPPIQSYRLRANTCDASVGATIKVYPDTYWHFNVTTEFEGKELKEIKIDGDFKEDQNSVGFSISSNKEISYEIQNDNAHTKFEGSEKGVKYGYKDDNTTVGFAASEKKTESYYEDKETQTKSHVSLGTNSLGAIKGVEVKDLSFESGGIKAKINDRLRDNLNGLFKTIKFIQFIKGLLDKLSASSGTPVKFELNYPKIDLDATWQWKEISGTPNCGFEYSITGGFHPLIGCGVEVDLLGAALLAIPGWGPIINKILHTIEYISGDDLIIKLKLNGDMNFDVGVTKAASAKEPTINSGNSHVDIILELSALLKLKKHSVIIGYGGGAKGSAKITITLRKPIVQNIGINLPCDYQFNGITLTSVEYVKEGSKWSSFFPDDEGEIEEKSNEIGTWLAGESHSFIVPLI